MMAEYNIPDSYNELFNEVSKNVDGIEYTIIDYGDGMGMDNVESLHYFLGMLGLISDNVVEDLGTLVYLKHDEYDFEIAISSSGLGDEFSHLFECSIVAEEDL